MDKLIVETLNEVNVDGRVVKFENPVTYKIEVDEYDHGSEYSASCVELNVHAVDCVLSEVRQELHFKIVGALGLSS